MVEPGGMVQKKTVKNVGNKIKNMKWIHIEGRCNEGEMMILTIFTFYYIFQFYKVALHAWFKERIHRSLRLAR